MSAAKPPTPEQAEIIDAYRTGEDLVVEAGAGTGKTTTLKYLANEKPNRRGLYIAYNKAIARDASADFPRNSSCSTAHALAFRAVGHRFKHRLDAPRMPAREVAKALGINEPLKLDGKVLAPAHVARLVMETVERYCRSAHREPERWHVPNKPGLDTLEDRAILRQVLVPLARKAWDDINNIDGRLRFDHSHYLKMWALSEPKLPADFVMLDEAQDANPIIASIVDGQTHAQRIMVGDRNQAIYGWNGAIDAMSKFQGTRLQLSQSFRFGTQIAAEANKWLEALGADLRLRGFDRISSMVAPLDVPDALLTRSNSGAMEAAIDYMGEGKKVALVGDGAGIKKLAEAAITLKAGAGTDHPELIAFRTWGEVQQYAEEDPAGSDLLTFVRLIDDWGPDMVIDAVDRLVPDPAVRGKRRRGPVIQPDVIISTAHKAKGREWDSVKVSSDFREPKRDPEENREPEIPREEAMLAYVTVTRAKLTLDRGGLAWIDNWKK
ncbi:UvrD-helicase domain-containing protein [Actinomadura sp. K4S16]|uniref:UvrD-helicase domain-containing protein n=1 Tax=Actinomadura sp. K4S16 TaxID=1316147 RepID=UPI0011F061F7|nr:UvrD-helicase domain-containing protein [Actinomadura sp. K4S16]